MFGTTKRRPSGETVGTSGWVSTSGSSVPTRTRATSASGSPLAARSTSIEEINAAIRAAAYGPLKGVLGYTDDKLVSMDFNHDPHSSVFHCDQTKVIDGTLCSILTWYDNEWGFSNRMADTAVAMGKLI